MPAAHLNHAEGSVAYAPQGDQEWHDIQPRRLLKRGDRLWTDRGSRAEVQAGGHALRMNGETQLILENVSESATQLSLTQGTVAATVTRVNPGDSFEVGTPNLAFRARQAGDYRIDVDTKQGVTRIVVLSGAGVVYGEKGEALEVRTGQRLTFRNRDLTRMLQPAFAATDDFDRWTGARKRGEPTVLMPAIAAAPEKPIPNTVTNGKTIVISGSAASLKQPPLPPQAKAPAPVAPAIAQPAVLAQPAPRLMPSTPPTLKVAAPVLPPAASVRPANIPTPPAPQPNLQAQAAREQQRLLAQQRAEQDRRALAAAEAKRVDDRRRVLAAKRAEEERRQVALRHEQEHKRQLAARRAEEEKSKKLALARRAAEEKRLAAARKAEQQKVAAEVARRQHLARLQEQARREEQNSVVRRAEAARRADDDRREELARRADQARREEDARREEQARREDYERRQRALAEQARREQARRDEEIWLRQQPPQQIYQPVRPQPMGVPARRIS